MSNKQDTNTFIEPIKVEEKDFTADDLLAIQKYKDTGLRNILKYQEVDVFNFFELYMSGKTYAEIAKISKAPHQVVLYLSDKLRWYEKRTQYYEELSRHIIQKQQQTQLTNMNTMNTIQQALAKFYSDQFNKYLATGDKRFIEKIDTKLVTQYYKTIELTQKLFTQSLNGGKGSKSTQANHPLVNINVGTKGDASIEAEGQTVDINEDNIEDVIAGLLDSEKKDK